jgi:hypothetical protein
MTSAEFKGRTVHLLSHRRAGDVTCEECYGWLGVPSMKLEYLVLTAWTVYNLCYECPHRVSDGLTTVLWMVGSFVGVACVCYLYIRWNKGQLLYPGCALEDLHVTRRTIDDLFSNERWPPRDYQGSYQVEIWSPSSEPKVFNPAHRSILVSSYDDLYRYRDNICIEIKVPAEYQLCLSVRQITQAEREQRRIHTTKIGKVNTTASSLIELAFLLAESFQGYTLFGDNCHRFCAEFCEDIEFNETFDPIPDPDVAFKYLRKVFAIMSTVVGIVLLFGFQYLPDLCFLYVLWISLPITLAFRWIHLFMRPRTATWIRGWGGQLFIPFCFDVVFFSVMVMGISIVEMRPYMFRGILYGGAWKLIMWEPRCSAWCVFVLCLSLSCTLLLVLFPPRMGVNP